MNDRRDKQYMKKQTDTFKRLRAVMKKINGDHRQIIKTMQDRIDYLMYYSGEDFRLGRH